MGSSLGCQTICDSFLYLTTQADIIEGKPKLAHVILSGADVSAEAFDDKFSERIQALLQNLTTYVSYEFEESLELLELQAKGAKNFSIIDATPINRRRNLHHFFTDSSEFFDDLYQSLLQPDDQVSRRLHSVRAGPEGMTYWILWNN